MSRNNSVASRASLRESLRESDDEGDRTHRSFSTHSSAASSVRPYAGRTLSSRGSLSGSDCDPLEVWKVVTVGDTMVGKTSCLMCVENQEPPSREPPATVTSTSRLHTSFQGVRIQLWDTTGQHVGITKITLKGAHFVLYMFAVDNRKSFDSIGRWYNATREALQSDAKLRDMPAALIANKIDLPAAQREVPEAEGRAYAERMGWLYIETSARQLETMQRCVREIEQAIHKRVRAGYSPPIRSSDVKRPSPMPMPERAADDSDGEEEPSCFGCLRASFCCFGRADRQLADETQPLTEEKRARKPKKGKSKP